MFVHKYTKKMNLTEGQGCQVCETKSAQLQIKTSQNVLLFFSPWFPSPSGVPSIENAFQRDRFNPRTKKQPMAKVLNYYNFAA